MEKKFLYILAGMIILATACKESTTEPINTPPIDDYFIFDSGVTIIYNIVITDSNGVTETGNRFIRFIDSTIVDGTTYQIQQDSFITLSIAQNNSSLIRKSKLGVFSYVDTTGFSSVIPDSLKKYVMIDREARLLFYPLGINLIYPVYTISVNYLIVPLNILDFDAKVESEETLILTLNSVQVPYKSYKIKYTFIIRLGTEDSDKIQYEAYGWAVKDIGFVKWDGDAEVFNFFLNKNIFPLETNVNMVMTEYNIP